MTALRLVLAGLALAFAGVIVWASLRASIGESFGRIVADPWGIVSLLDLYLGFVANAFVLAVFERRPVAVLLIAALFLLGNVITLVWLAWRLPTLMRRLQHRA